MVQIEVAINTFIRDFRHQMKDSHLEASPLLFLSTLHINPNYQTSGFGFEARKAVLSDNNFKHQCGHVRRNYFANASKAILACL